MVIIPAATRSRIGNTKQSIWRFCQAESNGTTNKQIEKKVISMRSSTSSNSEKTINLPFAIVVILLLIPVSSCTYQRWALGLGWVALKESRQLPADSEKAGTTS